MTLKLLLVAPEFAPVNTTGHFRSTAFARHLSEEGVQTDVVTLNVNDASTIFSAKVDTQLAVGLENVNIIRVNCELATSTQRPRVLEWLEHQFRLEEPLGKSWWPMLEPKLSEFIREECPDALMLSCPPFSLAPFIAKFAEQRRLPFILDMRDLWSQWSASPNPTAVHHWLRLLVERQVLKRASLIITVTEECADVFRSLCPEIGCRILVIPNGVDRKLPTKLSFVKTNRVRIGYVGSFYYNPVFETERSKYWFKRPPHHWLNYYACEESWLYRSPYFFFRTLADYNENRTSDDPEIAFEHIGKVPAWLKDMVKEFQLDDYVKFHGFIDRFELQKIIGDWDWALTTSEKVVGGRHYCLPSKLFEYLGAGLPIFGVLTPGAQEDFLRNGNLGMYTMADNREECLTTLRRAVSESHNFKINVEYLNRYQRAEGARDLLSAMRDMIR